MPPAPASEGSTALVRAYKIWQGSNNLIFLLLTSTRDPGIVPRNSRPPETEDHLDDENSQSEAVHNSRTRYRRTKEVYVNGMPVQVKYCETCMLYRPPRCSHCSICDNCVERFDHHCPWVGQCIGARNYRFYFLFVLSATILCIYVFAFCWVYVVRIMHGEETTVWKALIKTPASIVLIIYSFLLVWFVGGLTVFHSCLISRNQTTYENFRALYERQANPYNKGVIGNFKEVFLSSVPPSKNNFRAKIRKEPDFPSRRVNGNGSYIINDLSSGKTTSDIEMGMKPLASSWEEFGGELGREAEDDLSSGHIIKVVSALGVAGEYGEQMCDANVVSEEPEREAFPPKGSQGDSRSETQ
ncbi:hypothetical protein CDL15_Pgr003534 [Punica granatum]|uniref:S-acyltransferase n=1 Tax=Punica granatum TaxID=22663 RepID=A0A218X4D3_PUNGR|nr:hypothetical protein CDL15_Pgr003534 [Punica granatum]